MRAGSQPTLQFPLILLAVANLVILGVRLWPWPQVLSLPGDGVTALDPALSLLGYCGLIPWIAGSLRESGYRALTAASLIGMAGGGLLVCSVVGTAQSVTPSTLLEIGLPVAVALLWGFAGLRGAWVAGNTGAGMLAGAWSAMVSCLMASTAVLAESFRSNLPPLSTDPWKQYEALAIGPPATQALVHSLNRTTAYLLVGPVAGCIFGLVFAFFEQNKKS